MKKLSAITLLCLMLGHAHIIFAQNRRIMLFEKYNMGEVLMKNGQKIKTMLNYDAANQNVMYQQGKDEMILMNSREVDTVFIVGQKFIPLNTTYLQVVPMSQGTVYINWLLKFVSRGYKGAYGQISQVKSETINTSYWQQGAYENQLSEEQDVTNKSEYMFFLDEKFIKIKNEKDLIKYFPDKKEEIKTYIKLNGIDFYNVSAVANLINYCLDLKKNVPK